MVDASVPFAACTNTVVDLGGRQRTSVRAAEKPGVDSSILSLGTTILISILRYLYAGVRAHARQRLAEAQAVVHVGQPVPDQRLTFGRYLMDWVAGLVAGVKPRTVAYYDGYVRHHLLTSELAQKPLARLEPTDLRRRTRLIGPASRQVGD
jgi:hypothetical protein